MCISAASFSHLHICTMEVGQPPWLVAMVRQASEAMIRTKGISIDPSALEGIEMEPTVRAIVSPEVWASAMSNDASPSAHEALENAVHAYVEYLGPLQPVTRLVAFRAPL